MQKITALVTIENYQDKNQHIKARAVVNTKEKYLILPIEWMDKLGYLRKIRTDKYVFQNQRKELDEIFGPVSLKIEGFPEVSTEVLFLDMQPDDAGEYEPLLGYIPLEQANAAVDMKEHKLVALNYVDLK